jgi:hypothetical protein
MPKVDGVGFSELTALKIEHLSKIISMHHAVTRAVLTKSTVYAKQYQYLVPFQRTNA